MLKQNTVLILGAGSSMDYQMPSGAQLLNMIKKECNNIKRGDYKIIESSGFSTSPFVELLTALMDTDFLSIDAFLSVYKEHNDAGKFMIAACLLPCEKPENFQGFGIEKDDKRENWMQYLFQRKKGNSLIEFASNPVTFITFNYDRCLDYYIRRYMKGRYRATEAEIEKAMETLPIIHVHGQLGSLTQVPFGQLAKSYSAGSVAWAAKSIQIIHEAERSTQFQRATNSLCYAKRIGILGFGFHPTNIQRLDMKDANKHATVFATAKGMSKPEIAEAQSRIMTQTSSDFHQENCHYLCKHTSLLF